LFLSFLFSMTVACPVRFWTQVERLGDHHG
jgi:hypothetical protein